MPCYSPMLAGIMPGRTRNGKTVLRFLGKVARYRGVPRPEGSKVLPCKVCIGCRLQKSHNWAVRLTHEAKSWPDACFLTLTYSDDFLPQTIHGEMTLKKSHLRTFFNDLRGRLSYRSDNERKIKFFAVGEYGDLNGRPHYHAALFGLGSSECGAVGTRPARSGAPQFELPVINEVWKYGDHTVAALTFESAAYVARYALKKVCGSYEEDFGLIPERETPLKEFQSQSNGLGGLHLAEWWEDIYPADQVVVPGRGAFKPPEYYDRAIEKADPVLWQEVKEAREKARKEVDSSEWFAEMVERPDREGRVAKLRKEACLVRGL